MANARPLQTKANTQLRVLLFESGTRIPIVERTFIRLFSSTHGISIAIPVQSMDVIKKDFLHAIRMFRNRPAFTIIALLTIALGIGINTAMFSVINGVLL